MAEWIPFKMEGAHGWERPAAVGTSLPSAHVSGAETVILIHGINGTADEWRDFALTLPSHFRVLAIDLPGHGGNEDDAGLEATEVNLDTWVDTVVAALQGTPAHLVGSSFGGGVALAVAARQPELVDTVAKIGTGPGADSSRFALIETALKEQGPAAFFSATIPAFSYPPATDSTIVAQAVDRAASRSVEDALAIHNTGFCTDLRPVAAALPTSVPRLVLGGADDLTNPPALVHELATAAATSAYVIEGFAHLPQLTEPQRLADILTAYWAIPVEPTHTTDDLETIANLATMRTVHSGSLGRRFGTLYSASSMIRLLRFPMSHFIRMLLEIDMPHYRAEAKTFWFSVAI